MLKRKPGSKAIRLALTAVSTSLVCVATIVFSIYVPQTKGYFNIGETIIFVVALIFGPLIGAFSGGVGASLADILTGFYYYAPATLVVKAAEAGIVGILNSRRPKSESKNLWRVFTFSAGLMVGVLVASIGSIYYIGTVELNLGIPPPQTPNVTFLVPEAFWYALGAAIIILTTLIGFVVEPEFGWLVFSVLIGGSVMVTGYFLYQKFLLFRLFGVPDVIAETEIPINIGQMLIGLVVALPIVKIIRRSLPQLIKRK